MTMCPAAHGLAAAAPAYSSKAVRNITDEPWPARHSIRGRRCWPPPCRGEARSANRSRWAGGNAAESIDEPHPARVEPLPVAPSALLDSASAQPDTFRFAPAVVQPPRARGNSLRPEELPETIEESAAMVWEAVAAIGPQFSAVDRLVAANIRRVQAAFRRARVGPHHFAGSTGYGHGDQGRAALDQVYAEVMGAEAAMVRCQLVSGTHAIATALFACLRPGDRLLAVAGRPYDTLEEVIGLRGTPGHGSLAEWGVGYGELPLAAGGAIDWAALPAAVTPETQVALVQRSCGYADRPTLSLGDIARVVKAVRAASPDCLILVDNCYGEFTEPGEPCSVGADLCMGSLIKSPGGTIAPTGGYIAGRADLVAAAGARLTAPGVGLDAGAVPSDTLRLMFQGLFLAPQMVGEALKGGRLVAAVADRCGLAASPPHGLGSALPHPPSFITALRLGTRVRMLAFCVAVQSASPVGSYVTPTPGATPGYDDEVVFADGTFIDGSTAELSADGPLRAPFAVYCQGGTHWTHWALALEAALPALAAAS